VSGSPQDSGAKVIHASVRQGSGVGQSSEVPGPGSQPGPAGRTDLTSHRSVHQGLRNDAPGTVSGSPQDSRGLALPSPRVETVRYLGLGGPDI